MQSDDMIWNIINHQFCSYKTTLSKALMDKTHFCKHPYSNTGLCNRTSCPLANSLYSTIREQQGKVYLYIKTVERSHTPKQLWERILLSRNYTKAIQQLDEHLQYFPKIIIHRNKQRLTKIYQYLIRMRKLELKHRSGSKMKLIRIHRKVEKRIERRERKALIAAKLEKNIEQELITRLVKGTYGDIYNFPEISYQNALDHVEEKQQQEQQEQSEDEEEEEVEMIDDDDQDDILLQKDMKPSPASSSSSLRRRKRKNDEESDEEEEEEDEETEVMDSEEEEEEVVEYVEDLNSDEEDEEDDLEDMEYLGNGQWGERQQDEDEDDDDSNSDDDDDDSDDDDSTSRQRGSNKRSDDTEKGKTSKEERDSRGRRRRQPRLEIEYEQEDQEEQAEKISTTQASAVSTSW